MDQKWGDLFPSFVDGAKILRHPGYNIAYWNLHERKIKGSSKKGWTANGKPLRFLHFSGVKIDNSENISRLSKIHTIHNTGGYGDLLLEFRERVTSSRYQEFIDLPYGFFWEVNDQKNLHTPSDAASTKKIGMHKTPERYIYARNFRSFESYSNFKESHKTEIEEQRNTEAGIVSYTEDVFSYVGKCYVCDRKTTFLTTFLYSVETSADGKAIPNWREHVACEACRYPNRVRAAIHLFMQEFGPEKSADIYITEQATDLYKWLQKNYDNVQGSEFMGAEHMAGETVRGYRHENMEKLSFSENSFDYILSFDVLEHVAFYKDALKSVYKCLKPGGYFFFSAPANMDVTKNLRRAEINAAGELVHFMEPEYHGNPVDPENGALSFRDFSWELVDDMKEIGYLNPSIYWYWSKEFGYLGANQTIFVAQKPRG